MRRALVAAGAVLVMVSSGASAATTADTPLNSQHQLVPAYFYPAGTDTTNPWHIMCRGMRPGSIGILNPDSGPGVSRNPPYVEAVTFCHDHKQKVIGYVSTDYATRPLAQTLRDIDNYYRWYRVDGIFLDEMSNFPTAPAADGLTIGAYYQRVYKYVKAKLGGRGRYVVGNPGAPAATPWQLDRPVADNIVVFEDVASLYLRRSPPAWVLRQPSNEISTLVQRTTAAQRHRVCQLTRARNVGWLEVTNDGPPNTWDTLPPYWSQVAPRCP